MTPKRLDLDLLDDFPEDEIPTSQSGQPPYHDGPQYGAPDPAGAAAWCLAQHTQRHGPAPAPYEGHNPWLAALTKFWNESGAPLSDALHLALDTAPAGHDTRKIEDTVRGIYERDRADFGRKPYTASRGRPRPTPAPPVAAGLFQELPDLLQRCCTPFSGAERDVMLMSTLAALSGCFPTVSGLYDGQRLRLNLFVLIVGNAASGKSAMRCALDLLSPYDEHLQAQSRAALAEYEATRAAQQATRKGKNAPPPLPLAPPPFKMLIYPANQSSAALYESMADNNERGGIIGETELDTLSNALKQDWGGFSDVLRKAFHHERISLKRKGSPPLVLNAPALSILLSGTPGQVPKLIPNAENGLFSRFWFYKINQDAVWRDVGPEGSRPDLSAYFAPLAAEVTRMIHATKAPVNVALTREDWARLNMAGAAGLREAKQAAGAAGASTGFRLGPIVFRIICLLTLLRCFERGEEPAGELTAEGADVTTALALMDSARLHALAVLADLPTEPTVRSTERHRETAEKREQAHELHKQGLSLRALAEKLGVPKSTAGYWLKAEAA
jgi:hypothetical protein